MIFFIRRKFAILLIIFLLALSGNSQQVFFKSEQAFTSQHLSTFYSSISMEGDLLLFSANDYNLYAYNKPDGHLKWTSETSYKSNTPPYISGNMILAGVYENKLESAATMDTGTGKLIKKFPFGPLASRPFIKDGVLFGTAIYDYGCFVAYDMDKDTVLWSRFIAHGFSRQPYYFEKRIQANAEGDKWVELSYNGQLMDTACRIKASIYVPGIACVKNFYALTHDGKEITGKVAEKIFGDDYIEMPEVATTGKNTFILYDGKLTIIGNKLKIKESVEIEPLLDSVTINFYAPALILSADEETVSLLYSDHLVVYDHTKMKLKQIVDLSAWLPHQVLMDDRKLWIISKKDGLLYGLSF